MEEPITAGRRIERDVDKKPPGTQGSPMKLILAFVLSAVALVSLNPENPQAALGDTYEPFLTVDPKLAKGTARPNCLDNRCRLKHQVSGVEVYLRLAYSNGLVWDFMAKDTGVANFASKVDAFLFNSSAQAGAIPGKLFPLIAPDQTHAYTAINLVVTKGETQGLSEMLRNLATPEKFSLTLHVADYKKLLAQSALANTLNSLRKVFVIFDYSEKAMSNNEVTWIVTIDAAAFYLHNHVKIKPENILIQEAATFTGDVLEGNYKECPNTKLK